MNELFWLWSDDPVELDERVATEPDDHTVQYCTVVASVGM